MAEIPSRRRSRSLVSCRICLDNDAREGDQLIAPCRCKGTLKFVHRECLDHWRSIGEGFAFTHCSTCKAAFRLQGKQVMKYDIVTRVKHKLFAVKDFSVHFLIAQALILAFGGYIYMVDYEGMIHNAVDKYLSFLYSQSPISFYYSMGAMVFLTVMGCYFFIKSCLAMLMCNCLPATIVFIVTVYVFVFCGIGYGLFLATTAVHKSWHRHYQILMKRDLTKVYVVVDQRGHYTPPTLDPRHEQHLRYLHLL